MGKKQLNIPGPPTNGNYDKGWWISWMEDAWSTAVTLSGTMSAYYIITSLYKHMRHSLCCIWVESKIISSLHHFRRWDSWFNNLSDYEMSQRTTRSNVTSRHVWITGEQPGFCTSEPLNYSQKQQLHRFLKQSGIYDDQYSSDTAINKYLWMTKVKQMFLFPHAKPRNYSKYEILWNVSAPNYYLINSNN